MDRELDVICMDSGNLHGILDTENPFLASRSFRRMVQGVGKFTADMGLHGKTRGKNNRWLNTEDIHLWNAGEASRSDLGRAAPVRTTGSRPLRAAPNEQNQPINT